MSCENLYLIKLCQKGDKMMSHNEKLKCFYKENDSLLQNKMINNFLKSAENEELLEQVLMDPSDENIIKLDKQFKEYYLKMKIIKYISSLIYFYTIDFDKRNNQRNRRFMLTLDAPIHSNANDDKKNVIDVQPSPRSTETDYLENMHTFHELIESVKLYNAYQKLTSKQKEVLDHIYIHGFNNKELAHMYEESPQNISNIHKRALKKIKGSLNDDRR